jgi:hypothetical protein
MWLAEVSHAVWENVFPFKPTQDELHWLRNCRLEFPEGFLPSTVDEVELFHFAKLATREYGRDPGNELL